MKQEVNWEYWNEQKFLKLFQAIWMQHDELPKKYPQNLSQNDQAYYVHRIEMTSLSEQFATLLTSLRSDKDEGIRWQEKTEYEAANSQIAREKFVSHWKSCGFEIHANFKASKKGAPRKAAKEDLNALAKRYALEGRDYKNAFLVDAMQQFSVSESLVRSKVPSKKYNEYRVNFSKN